MRILLVDDDEEFRATLRRVLTQGERAVRVEEVGDGEEALRRVATRRPDVVVMDLTMPRMNGVEATRQLKTRWPDLPVIVLTVHDEPVYERTARAAGADRYLLKKTAGTALWPALVSLAPITCRPPVTPPQPGIGGSGDQEDSPRGLGDRPDWRARVPPL